MSDLEQEINSKLRNYASMKPLVLLNSLAFAQGALSITELSDSTGLSLSTAHRYYGRYSTARCQFAY